MLPLIPPAPPPMSPGEIEACWAQMRIWGWYELPLLGERLHINDWHDRELKRWREVNGE